jgi:hypothetical protein
MADMRDGLGSDVEQDVLVIEPYPAGRDRRTESALVACAAAGDLTAWTTLFDRMQPSMWAAAGAVGLPTAVANEVCELVWLQCAQHLDETLQPIRSWLVERVAAEAGQWHRLNRDCGTTSVRVDGLVLQRTAASD